MCRPAEHVGNEAPLIKRRPTGWPLISAGRFLVFLPCLFLVLFNGRNDHRHHRYRRHPEARLALLRTPLRHLHLACVGAGRDRPIKS